MQMTYFDESSVSMHTGSHALQRNLDVLSNGTIVRYRYFCKYSAIYIAIASTCGLKGDPLHGFCAIKLLQLF